MKPLLAALLLGAAGGASAECLPVETRACVLTLHGDGAPSAAATCSEEMWKRHLTFPGPAPFSDHDEDGWHETVFRLDAEPSAGCTCAVFRVFLENPGGLAVNIGNSPTNDGFGGDATTSREDAELQVWDRRLMVFSSDAPPGAPSPHDLVDLTLPLARRFLELEICDQTVRFRLEEKPDDPGPISGQLTGRANQTLFRLGTHPSQSAVAPAVRHSLYAAFNRVIDRIDGPPAKGRLSRSVRRVEIFFRP